MVVRAVVGRRWGEMEVLAAYNWSTSSDISCDEPLLLGDSEKAVGQLCGERLGLCGELSLKTAQVGGGEERGMSPSVVNPEITTRKRVIASHTHSSSIGKHSIPSWSRPP